MCELKCLFGQFDISDASAVEQLHLQVQNDFGPVDILVNNAAVLPIGSFMSGSYEEIKRVVDVNINAVLLVIKNNNSKNVDIFKLNASSLDDSCVFRNNDAPS